MPDPNGPVDNVIPKQQFLSTIGAAHDAGLVKEVALRYLLAEADREVEDRDGNAGENHPGDEGRNAALALMEFITGMRGCDAFSGTLNLPGE